MNRPEHRIMISFLLFVFVYTVEWTAVAQGLPPAKADGFVYHPNLSRLSDAILIEAFIDPSTIDNKDAWVPLKKAVEHYKNDVKLVVHLLPVPYVDNSYLLSRALHIVNNHSASDTFVLLKEIFRRQRRFYSPHTSSMGKEDVVKEVAQFATKMLGDSYASVLQSGFENEASDLKTRLSFKYSITRGVHTTPTFFVNGFQLPHFGTVIDYPEWKSIIDPLIVANGRKIKKDIEDEAL